MQLIRQKANSELDAHVARVTSDLEKSARLKSSEQDEKVSRYEAQIQALEAKLRSPDEAQEEESDDSTEAGGGDNSELKESISQLQQEVSRKSRRIKELEANVYKLTDEIAQLQDEARNQCEGQRFQVDDTATEESQRLKREMRALEDSLRQEKEERKMQGRAYDETIASLRKELKNTKIEKPVPVSVEKHDKEDEKLRAENNDLRFENGKLSAEIALLNKLNAEKKAKLSVADPQLRVDANEWIKKNEELRAENETLQKSEQKLYAVIAELREKLKRAADKAMEQGGEHVAALVALLEDCGLDEFLTDERGRRVFDRLYNDAMRRIRSYAARRAEMLTELGMSNPTFLAHMDPNENTFLMPAQNKASGHVQVCFGLPLQVSDGIKSANDATVAPKSPRRSQSPRRPSKPRAESACEKDNFNDIAETGIAETGGKTHRRRSTSPRRKIRRPRAVSCSPTHTTWHEVPSFDANAGANILLGTLRRGVVAKKDRFGNWKSRHHNSESHTNSKERRNVKLEAMEECSSQMVHSSTEMPLGILHEYGPTLPPLISLRCSSDPNFGAPKM